MVTNVKLYEILKPTLGEEAAMAVAEILPAASNLATKDDIAELGQRFAEVNQRFAEVNQRFAELETRILRWTFTFFVPLWAAVLATLVALVAQG